MLKKVLQCAAILFVSYDEKLPYLPCTVTRNAEAGMRQWNATAIMRSQSGMAIDILDIHIIG